MASDPLSIILGIGIYFAQFIFMKTFIIIFTTVLSTLALVFNCDAQNKTAKTTTNQEVAIVTSKEFNQILVKDSISLGKLIKPDNWTIFDQSLGEPLSFIEDHDFMGDTVIIEYSGATFEYSSITGDYELSKMIISSEEFWLSIRGKKIFPTMKIADLRKSYPEAFRLRRNNQIHFYVAVTDENRDIKYYDDNRAIISDTTTLSIILNNPSQEIDRIELTIRQI